MKDKTPKIIEMRACKLPPSVLNSQEREMLVAFVEDSDRSYMFSQVEGESKWYCDALFIRGLPSFVHGNGSRSCQKNVAVGELESLLNERKASLQTPA